MRSARSVAPTGAVRSSRSDPRRTGLTRTKGPPAGPDRPRIALDLLGGDHAPSVVVDGALRACAADPQLKLLLVGPRRAADEVMAALADAERDRVEVLEVVRGVGMSDPVARGADPSTSLGAGMVALAGRRVDAVVSAGPSGAVVAAAVLNAGRMPGVRRPALAAVLPSRRGALVLLDVGAGMQATPLDLVTHAALGAAYARLVVGLRTPRVGLLSVGAEPGKGDRLRRAADAALRVHPLSGATYVGPVEGHDVVTGARADVIVTDGFTGNVLLKGLEAVLGLADPAHAVPAAVPSSVPTGLPKAAALLGVTRTVIGCHGAAAPDDIASGIALAGRLLRARLTDRLGLVSGLRGSSAHSRPVGIEHVAIDR